MQEELQIRNNASMKEKSIHKDKTCLFINYHCSYNLLNRSEKKKEKMEKKRREKKKRKRRRRGERKESRRKEIRVFEREENQRIGKEK